MWTLFYVRIIGITDSRASHGLGLLIVVCVVQQPIRVVQLRLCCSSVRQHAQSFVPWCRQAIMLHMTYNDNHNHCK